MLDRTRIEQCLILVLMIAASRALQAPAVESPPPNILLIAIDDLRPELASYQADGIHTPHINRLAARSLQFNAAYCQYPVCNPSRSSFLTGLRPDDLGIFSNKEALRNRWPDLVTLPQLFRDNGYFTAGLGKLFHAGTDEQGDMTLFRDDLSFEHFYKAKGREPEIGRRGEGRRLGDGTIKWARWRAAEGGDEAQADGMIAAEAVRLLQMQRDQPFFIAVGFHKPHDPFVAPKEYFELYPSDSVQLNVDPDDRTALLRYSLPDSYDRFRAFKDRDRREFKRAYHACTSFVDAQIGKLLDVMDRRKLWDSTIIVLLGDHGYHLGEHGWWNKVTVFDIGARVPLVMWVPERKGMGATTESVVELLDLYPTLVELAGLEPPHRLRGNSLIPIVDDPQTSWGKPAFTQVSRGKAGMGYSVRQGAWRLTLWGDDRAGDLELYNVARDREGYYNQADQRESEATVRKLLSVLQSGFPSITRHAP